MRVSDEYSRRGVDLLLLENDVLRVELLAGKGGDVTEIRDKRTDTNVLFESPHEWRAPGEGYVSTGDPEFAYMDHYPGGWQDVLPAAGGPATVAGAPLALHGESAIAPWEYRVEDDAVALSLDLTRYPLRAERRVSLDGATVRVAETVTNRGEVAVDYSWLQHIALGAPLVGPEAELSVPCETVLVDPETPGGELPAGERTDWPTAPLSDGEWDFRTFPEKERRFHEVCAFTDLGAGRYRVDNPALDLAVEVRFPTDPFEYLWYWGAFGGFTEAPYFGRNYNVGLEPATSVPNAGLGAAVENGTAERLAPCEQESATVEFAVDRAE
jgi:galactose mutarotase-like enzyme